MSIYKFEDDYFKLIGRYSKTPTYNKRGREKYKSNEGFIAKGWSEGRYLESDIPLYSNNANIYRTEVKRRCNIPTRTINKMNMQSSSFYVKTVENEDSRVQLGVIVFEQIDPHPIDSEMLDNLIVENIGILTTIFKSMKTLHALD